VSHKIKSFKNEESVIISLRTTRTYATFNEQLPGPTITIQFKINGRNHAQTISANLKVEKRTVPNIFCHNDDGGEFHTTVMLYNGYSAAPLTDVMGRATRAEAEGGLEFEATAGTATPSSIKLMPSSQIGTCAPCREVK